MNFHPYSEIFPLLSDSELEKLAEDIRVHGLREPIWTYEGQILDGRNRWRACELAGVAHRPLREYEGDDPVAFVVSLNLHRRHLDESQRAMVANKLANMPQGARTDISPIGERLISQERAAELLNVGKRSVERAREVQQNGAPGLVSAVERGEVSVSAAAEVSKLSPDMQADIVSCGPGEIREVAKTLRSGPHVAHNSGNNEWYTPQEYIDAALEVMGSIDTDPASSDAANKNVGAAQFFTAEQDGLKQSWSGNVWMNPPYAQPLIADFCSALVEKFASGEIQQACVLVNNATDTAWFRALAESSDATCFTKGRVKFLTAEGRSGAPLQGQSILYFGSNAAKFAEAFVRLGFVYVGRPLSLAA